MAEKQVNKLDVPVLPGTLVDLELTKDIPEFFPEQWTWIKAKATPYEKGFKQTSSLFDGH